VSSALKFTKYDRENKSLPVFWRAFIACVVFIWTLTAAAVVMDLPRLSPLCTIIPTIVLFLLAGFAVAVIRRSFHAIELAVWISVTVQLINPSLISFNNVWPIPITVWLAIALLLTISRNKILLKPRPLTGVPEFITVFRICVLVLLLAENVVAWVQPFDATAMLSLERIAEEPAPYSRDNPTFITLGSSPANLEVRTGHPFSRVLSERLKEHANFRFFNMGGADSAHLVKVLRKSYESAKPVDAIILYAGFQDFTESALQRYLRQTNLLGFSEFGQNIALCFIRDSALFNFMLRCVKRLQINSQRSNSTVEAQKILDALKPNVESIIKMAQQHGDTVFVVTPVLNSKNVANITNIYSTMINDYYRSLSARYDNVTLVDFARAFATRYPDGALPNGEPFEMRNDGSGQPGDPFHLGPVGHQMIADTLEPEIRMWVEKWDTAK
jgi:lysophospholipase L1-like esterase